MKRKNDDEYSKKGGQMRSFKELNRRSTQNNSSDNIPIKKKRRKKASGKALPKIIIGLIVVFFVAGAVGIYFNQEEQMARIRGRSKELNTIVTDAREKKKENEDLFKKLDSLEYIEKMAREKLGMVKPGETLFPN